MRFTLNREYEGQTFAATVVCENDGTDAIVEDIRVNGCKNDATAILAQDVIDWLEDSAQAEAFSLVEDLRLEARELQRDAALIT